MFPQETHAPFWQTPPLHAVPFGLLAPSAQPLGHVERPTLHWFGLPVQDWPGVQAATQVPPSQTFEPQLFPAQQRWPIAPHGRHVPLSQI
jgi:hypothetical protein